MARWERIRFRFALKLLGTRGRLISFDQSGVVAQAIIELQDADCLRSRRIGGWLCSELAGMDFSGARIGALGLIFPDGNGFISGQQSRCQRWRYRIANLCNVLWNLQC